MLFYLQSMCNIYILYINRSLLIRTEKQLLQIADMWKTLSLKWKLKVTTLVEIYAEKHFIDVFLVVHFMCGAGTLLHNRKIKICRKN